MKYIAPVEPRYAASAWAQSLDADELGGIQIVELAGAEHGFVRNGSRRWLGVFIAIAAAVTGFGFVSHTSEPSLLGPAQARSETATVALANPLIRVGPTATDPAGQSVGEQPVVVVAPADGAKVTSGVVMTGGVVVVEADARRALGTVHASVSMGELVLGSRDVDVSTVGPLQFTVPLFPPPFDAPVVLRLQAAVSSDGPGIDVSRPFRLGIPSAVGFWDASPTSRVNRAGRVQVRIRGYGPLSARTMEIAVRDGRGQDVASASVRIAFDGDLAGAVAGRILGLGSFDTTVWLPSGPNDHLSLRATWRDAATGARLHMDTTMAASGV